jgi:hypothetical protein
MDYALCSTSPRSDLIRPLVAVGVIKRVVDLIILYVLILIV